MKEIIMYKVGNRLFKNKEEAILYENELKTQGIMYKCYYCYGTFIKDKVKGQTKSEVLEELNNDFWEGNSSGQKLIVENEKTIYWKNYGGEELSDKLKEYQDYKIINF